MSSPDLSLTGKRWHGRLGTTRHPDIASLTAALRAHRGVDAGTGGPFPIATLPDAAKAIDRVTRAVKDGERIAVFGDYDCDGITSTALLARMLRRRGAKPLLRLPHRQREGYGLKMPIVEEMAREGVTLLLTADTGGSCVAEIAEAARRGIDVIVLDHHHLPSTGLPPAYALLHPALLPVPLASPPAAAGVTWAFVDAVERAEGSADWEDRDTDLALAALGTVADLVELKDGNRLLTQEGLRALGRLERGALAFLKMQAGIEGTPKSSDIAFRLAPRINAAGRMADPAVALEALLGSTEAALQLEDWNRERQSLVSVLAEDATRSAGDDAMICLMDPRYSPGVCGLIAGKVTDKFGRPSLAASADPDGRSTASLRSVPGYNVTEGLERVSDLLTSFGGHAMAAGCTFESRNFPELSRRLAEDVRARMDASALVPSLAYDAELRLPHVTLDLCRALSDLEPFGQGNPEPRFVLHGVRLTDARRVGRDATHLQARAGSCKLIGFGLGHLAQETAIPLDLLVQVGIDTWQGAMRPQMYLQDLRVPVAQEVGGKRREL